MKKAFLLMCACLLFASGASAQSALSASAPSVSDPLRDTLDYVFRNLDKSQVPTAYLEEYGTGLLAFRPYNGALVDSNKVTATPWRALYAGLQSARITGTNPMQTLPAVNTVIDNQTTGSTIPIPILHYDYAALKPNAITSNLLRASNNQLFDVAGRAQSPYEQRTLFVAAPASDSILVGNLSFVLRSDLYFTNTGKTVGGLWLDGGDGNGYVAVSWNTPQAFTYGTAGDKTVKIKITYTDGTAYQSHATFKVRRAYVAARYAGAEDLQQAFAATANHSGGTVFVKYSTRNALRQLVRPLIVVEGYDVSAIAPSQQDNYSYNDLVNGVERNGNFIPATLAI